VGKTHETAPGRSLNGNHLNTTRRRIVTLLRLYVTILKDVIIPISALGEPREDTVFLKLDKHQIESLPTFPLHRCWS
jgi:hypothetical protein